MPEPHRIRGEVSEADVADPAPDAGKPTPPTAVLSGQILTDEADEQQQPIRKSPDSPPHSPEQHDTAEGDDTEPPTAGESQPDEQEAAQDDAEPSGSEAGEPDSRPAPDTGADWPTAVQARVEIEPTTDRDIERDTNRDTDRLPSVRREQPGRGEDSGQEATERTEVVSSGPVVAPPGGSADSGPPTMRIAPVQVPPPVAEEERTQQFRRPDFTAPPRSAQASDFAGLAAPPSPVPPPQHLPAVPSVPQGPETTKRRLHRRWRLIAAVAALVVLAIAVWLSTGSGLFTEVVTPTAAPPPPVQLQPAIKPLGEAAPVPTPQGLAAALAGPMANPALGTFGGMVIDAQTGRTLWQQNTAQPLTPASTGKLLAMSAVLLKLDHQERFTTKVVRGVTPGSVVLVGGGDPTLSSLPAGKQSVYPGAAHLDDLVAQVKAATGGRVTSVQVDTSHYTGPTMAPGWLLADVPGGSIAPIDPVMLDGGRSDPTYIDSPRTLNPAVDAARELARRLGAPTNSVTVGTAPPGAAVLGQVVSPTVQDMVETVLQQSDDVLAEALARQVAIETGNPPSFVGAVNGLQQVLTDNRFSLAGVTLFDASGLSTEDRMPSQTLAALLAAATMPQDATGNLPMISVRLRPLLPGLPVAGGTGTLSDRFQGNSARGWIRAKTGTLDVADGLAGTAITADGRALAFVFLSNGASVAAARPALDAAAEALHGCGCR